MCVFTEIRDQRSQEAGSDVQDGGHTAGLTYMKTRTRYY